ncbi:MAG: molybdenum cofactor guanylyltransferase [Vulcanimicrobiaceae bacterium]
MPPLDAPKSCDEAVVILAGGQARRFAQKLEQAIDGVPLVVRVYRNLRGYRPTYICARRSFPVDIDAQLDCPMIVDDAPGRGPLVGMITAFHALPHRLVYAVAADMPLVDAQLLTELSAGMRDGDEAVIPEHDGRIEPLPALYDRRAFLRHARSARDGSIIAVIAALRARRLPMSGERFLNINTPEDLARAGKPVGRP